MPPAFSISVKSFKRAFFDRAAITSAADKAHAQVQAKFGAFVRRRMKSSIRYKDATAPPGSPPFAHRSKGFTRRGKRKGVPTSQPASPLRELIFFARDPATNSVVIGPALFGAGGAGVLERGGSGTYKDPATGRTKVGRFRPHPFARPAGEAEAAKLPDLLRRSIN